MRIIAGQWKGRTLCPVPKHLPLRPTSDRIRGAMFNVLEHRFEIVWPETTVLDVCAGSGALGFEALSRGAVQATFIEEHREAVSLIHHNSLKLGASERTSVQHCRAQDMPSLGNPATLVFFDPPYDADELPDLVFERLSGEGILARPHLIVWETGKNNKILNKNIEILHEKVYHATQVRYCRLRS